jgi:hypothetical protein
MALPTFLELVNDVLVRMREPEVSTVNENVLSKLVGKHVNDAKRQVEDSFHWNALQTIITVPTVLSTSNYTLTGSNARTKILYVWDNTNKNFIQYRPKIQMQAWLNDAGSDTGIPHYFNFNGVDSNGAQKVDVYPVPNGVYSLQFNLVVPQENLVSDTATMVVPLEPVTHLAYAKALVERGEDGGLQSSEAYALFKQVLADYIAIESGRHPEGEVWEAV